MSSDYSIELSSKQNDAMEVEEELWWYRRYRMIAEYYTTWYNDVRATNDYIIYYYIIYDFTCA